MPLKINMLFPKKKIPFWLITLLTTTLGIGIYLRFEALGYVLTIEWITRDFERAFNILELTQLLTAYSSIDVKHGI